MRAVVDEVEVLRGGVANAGAVVRVGDDVLRPAPSNSVTIHRLLRYLRRNGVSVAPEPKSLDDGREQLAFIPGEVPIPPYPEWAQSDDTLTSIARVIRSFHDASRGFAHDDADTWSAEMSDDQPGGPVVCHNDVCLENVVFRAGAAVALLDFDFAAPGRPGHDLGCFARMCVPVDDDVSRGNLGWNVGHLPDRLRMVADVYGCTSEDRRQIIATLDRTIASGGEFVRRHAEAGEPGFVEMWAAIGGMERFDRRREWWARHRNDFATTMRP